MRQAVSLVELMMKRHQFTKQTASHRRTPCGYECENSGDDISNKRKVFIVVLFGQFCPNGRTNLKAIWIHREMHSSGVVSIVNHYNISDYQNARL